MLKLKKIAVTGGLAAGKTTVCQFFKELGAYVISADEVVHQLLSSDTALGQQVVNLLGSEVISEKIIDRKKIATKVFTNPDLLHALEKLMHPAVFDAIEQKYRQISKEKKYSLFVAEIPLLFETEAEDKFDAVITVYADLEVARRRYHSGEEFDQRMKRQFEPKVKAKKSHYVLQNNGNLEELKINVKNLYSQLAKQGV